MNFQDERGIYTTTWGGERIPGAAAWEGVQLPLRALATSLGSTLIHYFFMNFQEERGIYTKTWGGERILDAVTWECATTPWGPRLLTWFYPYTLFFLSFLIFRFFLFSNLVFKLVYVKLGVSEKFWMSSFHRLWSHAVWSYNCCDILLGREVMQCKIFCVTFLKKMISLNLEFKAIKEFKDIK